jgi:hypothetical protein
MRYTQFRVILILLSITTFCHAQCFTCGWPDHIDLDAVHQIVRVLDMSQAQQRHIADTHERHRDDWMAAQDELVVPLATFEQHGSRSASTMQEAIGNVTSVIRRARSVRSQLQDIDTRFFDDVEASVAAGQRIVLDAMRHQRRGRWHERSVNGMIETPDPALLIAASTPPSEHRIILEAIEPVLAKRVARLRRLESKTFDCIVHAMKAAASGQPDLPTFQSAFTTCTDTEREERAALVTWQIAKVVKAMDGIDLSAATRRLLMQSFGEDSPVVDDPLLAQFIDRLDQLDPLPANHAAAEAVLNEHFAQLRDIHAMPDTKQRAAALNANSRSLHEQLTEVLGRENTLAIFTPQQHSSLQDMLAVLLTGTKPTIPTQSGCGVLTSRQFETLLSILGLLETDRKQALDIRDLTRDAFLRDADIKSAVAMKRNHTPDAAANEWVAARLRGMAAAADHDASMVDLLAQLGGYAPDNLRAQLAHAWISETRRSAVIPMTGAFRWVPSDDNTHLINLATEADLDLNDPVIALPLLEQNDAVSNAIDAAVSAVLAHSAAAPGTPGFDTTAKRQVTQLNTLARAKRDAAAAFSDLLPDALRTRWSAQLIRSRWPAITGPLNRAQTRLLALTSNRRLPHNTRTALRGEFANVLAAATLLEDQAIRLLLAEPPSQNTLRDVSPAARIRLQAIQAELNTLLDVWSTYERDVMHKAAASLAGVQ